MVTVAGDTRWKLPDWPQWHWKRFRFVQWGFQIEWLVMDWKYQPLKQILDKRNNTSCEINSFKSDYFSLSPFAIIFEFVAGFFCLRSVKNETETKVEKFKNSILKLEVSWHSFLVKKFLELSDEGLQVSKFSKFLSVYFMWLSFTFRIVKP